jgi:hypothetical protein
MFKNKTLTGEAHVSLQCFDMKTIRDKAQTQKNTVLELPSNYDLKIGVDAQCFDYDNFHLKNLKVNVRYERGTIKARDVSFATLGGGMNGNVSIEPVEGNRFVVKSEFKVANVVVEDVMKTFNNFDQTYITDKNVRGNATCSGLFYATVSNNFAIDTKSLLVECSLSIADGQLLKFEPMKKMSTFVKVEELENISFSTLKNNFTIQNERLTIPQMDIKSNAFSIVVAGYHNFDKTYEYRLQVYLNEILNKKFKSKNQAENFGEIKDDGLGRTKLPLLITGTASECKISYDVKMVKEQFKENMKKEKIELGRIIREEFNIKPKDSVKAPSPKPETKSKFQIEFE